MNELESLGVPKIETDEVREGGLLKQGAFGRIYDAKGFFFGLLEF